jgi:hypothetical protein
MRLSQILKVWESHALGQCLDSFKYLWIRLELVGKIEARHRVRTSEGYTLERWSIHRHERPLVLDIIGTDGLG